VNDCDEQDDWFMAAVYLLASIGFMSVAFFVVEILERNL